VKIRAITAQREDGAEAADQALAAEASLRAMLRYAESANCRRAFLLAHFGERYAGARTAEGRNADAPLGCGACDACAPLEGSTESIAEIDVTEQAYKLLSCVKRTGERYGAGHVVDVLLGSRNERVLGLGHARLSTWGIGKEWARGQWLDLAVLLARKGFLAKDEDYGVLRLTERAYAAFRDKTPIAAALPPRSKERSRPTGKGPRDAAARPAPDGREARIEEALRSLRKSLAAEAKVPNYMIFSDRTLYDLIAKAPADPASLLEVFGMGKVKAARFGEAILRALKDPRPDRP
jgi:ATP-dependent DNA helicase RecQ